MQVVQKPNDDRVIAIAAVLAQNTGAHVVTSSLHYAVGESDAEKMKELAVNGARQLKPGYAIEDVVVQVITPYSMSTCGSL